MTALALKKSETMRTTVSLPVALSCRIQEYVEEGVASSRNEFIVAALEHFIEYLERQAIDAQFAAMADDLTYQSLNVEMAKEFAESDWEALEKGRDIF